MVEARSPRSGHPRTEAELSRLTEVRACAILDTAPEPEFDALARFAARIVGADHGAIMIIDGDRVWCKAATTGEAGLDVPRNESLCTEVLHGPLVIQDAAADARFAHHPCIAGTGTRAYVAVPVASAAGLVVGAVAAWGTRPLRLTAGQLDDLWSLAQQARALLELRRRDRELRDALDDRERQTRQLQLSGEVLGRIASGNPLPSTLTALTGAVEELMPGALCSVLLLRGRQLFFAAGAKVPPELRAAVDGLVIGPDVGACGTAAHTGQFVISGSIATDPRWHCAGDLPARLGLASCWSHPIVDCEGRVLGTFATYFPVERFPSEQEHALFLDWVRLAGVAIERAEHEQNLRTLAECDALTGLVNRKILVTQLGAALAQARPERSVAALFLDLDRFKLLNDTLGHGVGDAYLRVVASRLEAAVRPEDTVGRLGGDEFLVVARGLSGVDEAEAVARRLVDVVSAPVVLGSHTRVVSASVGIALATGPDVQPESLIRDADAAMYAAKQRGRNSVAAFTAAMRASTADRLTIQAALRDAAGNGELRLAYQPKVNLATGEVVAYEALLRWRHAALGDVPPGRFIPVAEEMGVIADLGRWAMGEACEQLARWRAQGTVSDQVTAWVNLSGRQLSDAGLVDHVTALLSGLGLPGSNLGVEITESALMDDTEMAQSLLASFKRLGVSVAIDDFGIGFSSLAQLKRFSVDALKIDRSFVAGVDCDDEDRAIVRAIVDLASALDLTTVAEGVETPEQCRELRRLGCTRAQGFLFARPVEAELVTAGIDLRGWT